MNTKKKFVEVKAKNSKAKCQFHDFVTPDKQGGTDLSVHAPSKHLLCYKVYIVFVRRLVNWGGDSYRKS